MSSLNEKIEQFFLLHFYSQFSFFLLVTSLCDVECTMRKYYQHNILFINTLKNMNGQHKTYTKNYFKFYFELELIEIAAKMRIFSIFCCCFSIVILILCCMFRKHKNSEYLQIASMKFDFFLISYRWCSSTIYNHYFCNLIFNVQTSNVRVFFYLFF